MASWSSLPPYPGLPKWTHLVFQTERIPSAFRSDQIRSENFGNNVAPAPPRMQKNESVPSTIRKWPTTLSFPSTLRTYSACSFLVNWTYFLSNYAQFIPSTLRLLPSTLRSSEYAHFCSIYVQQQVLSVTFFWFETTYTTHLNCTRSITTSKPTRPNHA